MRKAETIHREQSAEVDRLRRALNARLQREQRTSPADLRPPVLPAVREIYDGYWRLVRQEMGSPYLNYVEVVAWVNRNVRADFRRDAEELLYELLTEHKTIDNAKRKPGGK